MVNKRFDVIGLGNAIVDIHADVHEDFLATEGIIKGAMNLIDEDKAKRLYSKIDPKGLTCGGSVANTMVAIASMGGNSSYVGKVSSDDLGEFFAGDIRRYGVHYETPYSKNGSSTARCVALVTPDAERSFGTYLGACESLDVVDVDEDRIRDAKILYVEGYLWDLPRPKQAAMKAMDLAKRNKVKIALSLSDSFCVDRFRLDFLDVIKNYADILLGNEDEIKALFGCDGCEDASRLTLRHCSMVALTRGKHGSLISDRKGFYSIPAMKVESVVDTTGAGDLFAAGFLYGIASERPIDEAGQWGNALAAEIIKYYGSKPKVSLNKIIEDKKWSSTT